MVQGEGAGAIKHRRAADDDSGRVRQCGDEQVGSSLSRPSPLSLFCDFSCFLRKLLVDLIGITPGGVRTVLWLQACLGLRVGVG